MTFSEGDGWELELPRGKVKLAARDAVEKMLADPALLRYSRETDVVHSHPSAYRRK
jgi:hypothetical protein